MAKAKEPQDATPAAPAAASEGGEEYDIAEVVQDLTQQIAGLTFELSAARAVIRKLRKELVAKSQNVQTTS